MHYAMLFILLSSFLVSTSVAQEQPSAASAEPLRNVEPATPVATNTEKPTGTATAESGAQTRGMSRSGIDTDGNGIIDQVEIDRMPSFVRDKFENLGVVLKAGMTVEEAAAAFSAAKKVPASQIKVFALRNCQAISTTDLLLQLITTRPFRAVADELHNSVVVTGSAEQMQAVEALLRKLDEAPRMLVSERKEDKKPVTAETSTKDIQHQVTQLRKDYETADKQAHELADSFRQTPNAKKKAELRTAVQRTFTLRQSLLRAELVEMQTRLLQTQQSIDMRERVADQIVDRRVDDLLNPELDWEGSSRAETPNPATTNTPQTNIPPAPIGLGLPENINPDAWGQAQNGLRLAMVVKSENALWNESQEVQYVVENVSSSLIKIKGQRNDQLASLLDVRQTSQAQVQTSPRVNSGVMESGSTVELLPGQQAVVARVWIGIVENETDATPKGDPQLLVIDSNAWRFQNKIYLLRGSLQPDPDLPTIAIHSGQVGIAFHKPANVAVDDAANLRPEEHVGDAGQADSKAAMLDRLQGYWDVEVQRVDSVGFFEPSPFDGMSIVWEIRGNQIFLHHVNPTNHRSESLPKEPIYKLELGEPGTPQPIDLERDNGPLLRGIISIDDDVVRICVDKSGETSGNRIDSFAVTEKTDILVLRRTAAPVNELEGDWHKVSATDQLGNPVAVGPANMSFRNNQFTLTYPGGQNTRRVEIDSGKKEIRYFKDGDDSGFVRDYYVLEGDQLTTYEELQKNVYRRGHVILPKTVPPATEEQKLRWRSAIVEIVASGNEKSPGTEVVVGRGVVVTSNGLILTHLAGGWEHSITDWKIHARCDDGSLVSLEVAEDESGGFLVLQRLRGGEFNHLFPLTTTPSIQDDEVYVGLKDANSPIGKSRIILTDRKMATADAPLWQLEPPESRDLMGGQPVLSSTGELLAITLQNTGELSLAMPVEQLKKMFPKTFGQ